MSRKEKRIVAGQVCNFISSQFRAADGPNSATILHLHSILQKNHKFTLLGKLPATTKDIACMAIKSVFIMEKIKSGYSLAKIPDCVSRRNEFINQYFNFRTRKHRYRIENGPIATASSVTSAIQMLRPYLSTTSTMAPCNT